MSLASLRQELLHLLCQDAYQEGDFTLASGQKSTYYINCKPVTLSPRGAYLVGRLFLAHLPAETRAVAGLTLGADPLVVAVTVLSEAMAERDNPQHRSYPGLIIRKEAKGHGTRAYIEGPTLPPQTPIAVLEDVVTTGHSALQAVERLRAANYCVESVLAIVDRQCGGQETFQKAELGFQSLFTIQDLQAYFNK